MLEFIRNVWRRLPSNFRARFGAHIRKRFDTLASPAPDLAIPVPGPLSIIGYLGATLGLGEGARLQLDLLRRLGIHPNAFDLTEVIAPDRDMLPNAESRPSAASGSGGVAILHINPPELALASTRTRLHRSTYRVGYWVWELEDTPPQWLAAQRLVNEIWAPSEFCANALRQLFTLPVHVMPYPVVHPFSTQPIRPRFGLEPNDFVVLFAYDVRSSHARKNPEGAIQAFRRGLSGQPHARMLIKISNLEFYPQASQLLGEAIGGDRRISLLTETLSQPDMAALVDAADAVVSLHRAEGFGMLLAQAMLAGKAVIATNWSGNCDFMDESTSLPVPFKLVPIVDPQGIYTHGRWAEPDVTVAAQHLRSCCESMDKCRMIGGAAAQRLRQMFGPALEQTYRRRLNALGQTGTKPTLVD